MTARTFFQRMYLELTELDACIEETTSQSHELLKHDEDYKRIQQIPGIGPIISLPLIQVSSLKTVGSFLLG